VCLKAIVTNLRNVKRYSAVAKAWQLIQYEEERKAAKTGYSENNGLEWRNGWRILYENGMVAVA
jgi:hypothetical protein